jgi:hypothetical protein
MLGRRWNQHSKQHRSNRPDRHWLGHSEGVHSAVAEIGGTASPIFTAIWAIADQYNGKPLGQAGPAVARLKSGQSAEVLLTSPSTSPVRVYDSNGPTLYSQDGLFRSALLPNQVR